MAYIQHTYFNNFTYFTFNKMSMKAQTLKLRNFKTEETNKTNKLDTFFFFFVSLVCNTFKVPMRSKFLFKSVFIHICLAPIKGPIVAKKRLEVEYVTSWKLIKIVDDSSCTRGCMSFFHPINAFFSCVELPWGVTRDWTTPITGQKHDLIT